MGTPPGGSRGDDRRCRGAGPRRRRPSPVRRPYAGRRQLKPDGHTICHAYVAYDTRAFAARAAKGMASSVTTAPPWRCATTVMTLESADIDEQRPLLDEQRHPGRRRPRHAPSASRPGGGRACSSGHQSSSSSVNGSVTSIGFAIRPEREQQHDGRVPDAPGPPGVAGRTPRWSRNQKSVLRTSLRSAIHATDSTCSGCRANSAATHALRHRRPVIAVEDPEEQQRVHRVQPGTHQMVARRAACRTARRRACGRSR